MTLQKNFPKKRHFYFWAILAGYLASTSSKASETDRRLFGTLAYKMISKAASEVPADPVSGWPRDNLVLVLTLTHRMNSLALLEQFKLLRSYSCSW